MIGVIQCGMGNLLSVVNALNWIEAPARLIVHPDDMAGLGGVILPGVGAFIPAMKQLDARGFTGALTKWAREDARPLLGVCLGMQLLARTGTEGGAHAGLGLVDADIVRLASTTDARVPHMGWNRVEKTRDTPLWEGLEFADCYFVHSYHMTFDDPAKFDRTVSGITQHGSRVVAMVETGNVWGTQFHPEKSQKDGLAILKNFAGMVKKW